MKKRVVITGIGANTPIGNKKDNIWKSVVNGISGISKVTYFDTTNYPCTIASQVKSFNLRITLSLIFRTQANGLSSQ